MATTKRCVKNKKCRGGIHENKRSHGHPTVAHFPVARCRRARGERCFLQGAFFLLLARVHVLGLCSTEAIQHPLHDSSRGVMNQALPPPCVELCPILRAWSTKLIFLFSELHSHRPNHPPPPLFLSPFLRRVPTPPPKTTRRTLFILIFTVNRLLR